MKALLFFCFFQIFCLFQTLIFATITEPLSLEIGQGYREDSFKWRISESSNILNYEESYKHPRYLQTIASLRLIERDIYFFASFASSFFASCNMHQKDRNNALYFFTFKNKGYDLESLLELGYGVNLTPDRLEMLALIPLFGYSGFWKNYHRKDPISMSYGASSNLPKKLSQVYYGPYLGVNLEFVPCKKTCFELGYHFNWLSLKQRAFSDLEEGEENLYKIINDKVKAHSHAAFGKITYIFNQKFKLALLGKYDYFLSQDKADVKYITKSLSINTSIVKNNFFSRWWYAYFGAEFIFQF